MNAFQWLGVALVGFMIALCVRSVMRRAGRPGHATAWILLWLATALVLVRPQITVTLAAALGIGRGADLVFYCAILAAMLGFFFTYLRARQLESAVTKLVRQIALLEAGVSPSAGRSGAAIDPSAAAEDAPGPQ